MGIVNNILAGSSGQATGYNLTNSLRFRRSASAYLNRTPASAGNRQKFTYSVWVKRGALETATSYYIHSSGPNTSSDRSEFLFTGDYTLCVGFNISGTWYEPVTTAVFRDPSAWYHIVATVDTTQATSSNRIKIYVNGVQQTLSGSFPPQNSNTSVNNTVAQAIGYYTPSSAGYFDGYMAEFHFIDGQALTPSSFGETSTTTGVWQPIEYTGSYGTNGFYLPFTDNSALTTSSNVGLGKDFSGNGNYWTTNNISITSGSTYDSMTDVPTLTSATASNFCTWNPLNSWNGGSSTLASIANGNLFANLTTTANPPRVATATMPFGGSGKVYFEIYISALYAAQIGIVDSTRTMSVNQGFDVNYNDDGSKTLDGTNTSYGASYTTGDTIGCAVDFTNNEITFYKNGVSQGAISYTMTGKTYVPFLKNGGGGGTTAGYLNCGQQPWAYAPPTGYSGWNTYNLPTPTIGATASSQANKYMDATLYTGTGSSNAVVNAGGFQPDLVWIKSRSNAYPHFLYDAVRGVGKYLASNNTDAETTTTQLTSFNSNGFTVNNDGGSVGTNNNGSTFVGWQWKGANTTVTNTAGSITSTVSANTTSGFSVVTYTGNGSSGTVGHGLGVAPKMVIVKVINESARDWCVYHASIGATGSIFLNLTSATATSSAYWNDTSPTSTVFSVGNAGNTNNSGKNFIAYCFAEVAGFSKFGSYTGNGSSDGPFTYTGFRPKYVMWKRTNTSGDGWWIIDSARSPENVADDVLLANLSNAESVQTTPIDFLSNGFKMRNGADGSINANGSTYIYMAFAENPFKYSLAR